MSNVYYNCISISGSHKDLEKFMLCNFKLRYDIEEEKFAGKIPLFCLSAFLPKPNNATQNWEEEHWGCYCDTTTIVTYEEAGWTPNCEEMIFCFSTFSFPPCNWFYALAEAFPILDMEILCICSSASHAVNLKATGGKVQREEWCGMEFYDKCTREFSDSDTDTFTPIPLHYPSPANPDFLPSPRSMKIECAIQEDFSPFSNLFSSCCGYSDISFTKLSDNEVNSGFEAVSPSDLDEGFGMEDSVLGIICELVSSDFFSEIQSSTPSFNWWGFLGLPKGMVQDTDNVLHVIRCICDRYDTPTPDYCDFYTLRVSPKPFHLSSDWDRYTLENLK